MINLFFFELSFDYSKDFYQNLVLFLSSIFFWRQNEIFLSILQKNSKNNKKPKKVFTSPISMKIFEFFFKKVH